MADLVCWRWQHTAVGVGRQEQVEFVVLGVSTLDPSMSNIGMSAMYEPTAALDQEATSGTAPPRPVGYDRVRQALLTRL
ncbi:hypothetical protein ABZ379_38390 [Streptomyces canus]|uniref:hypothetical protein n=1 Tax=Streptomyces canus TaxID=58343 RepID=UPI0033C24857